MEKVFLTWKDIEDKISIITSQIRSSGNKIDCIIAIGRGGMVPARLLADSMNIHTLYMYPVKLYEDNKMHKSEKGISLESFKHDIEGKNCLLVDDIYDTGETIITTINELVYNKFKSLKIATLMSFETKLDYCGELLNSTIEKRWYVFPWEISEFKEGK